MKCVRYRLGEIKGKKLLICRLLKSRMKLLQNCRNYKASGFLLVFLYLVSLISRGVLFWSFFCFGIAVQMRCILLAPFPLILFHAILKEFYIPSRRCICTLYSVGGCFHGKRPKTFLPPRAALLVRVSAHLTTQDRQRK